MTCDRELLHRRDKGSKVGATRSSAGVDTDADLANYEVTLVNATLSITKAPLTVTAADKTKVYGDATRRSPGRWTGLKNSDHVTGAQLHHREREGQQGGWLRHHRQALGTDAVLGNYDVKLVNATLTVTKAPLNVTAADKTKLFRAQNPALTGTIAGIKNGDVLTASYTTTATTDSPVGSYAIVPSITGDAIGNYRSPWPTAPSR